MTFTAKLAELISDETGGAMTADPQKVADITEGLAAVLGRFIALHLHGDAASLNTMLEGTTQYIFSEAAATAETYRKIMALAKTTG